MTLFIEFEEITSTARHDSELMIRSRVINAAHADSGYCMSVTMCRTLQHNV